LTDEEKAAAAAAEAEAKKKAEAEAKKARSSEGAVLDEQQALKRRLRRVEGELGLEDELAAAGDGDSEDAEDLDDSGDLFDDLLGDDGDDLAGESEAA